MENACLFQVGTIDIASIIEKLYIIMKISVICRYILLKNLHIANKSKNQSVHNWYTIGDEIIAVFSVCTKLRSVSVYIANVNIL